MQRFIEYPTRREKKKDVSSHSLLRLSTVLDTLAATRVVLASPILLRCEEEKLSLGLRTGCGEFLECRRLLTIALSSSLYVETHGTVLGMKGPSGHRS